METLPHLVAVHADRRCLAEALAAYLASRDEFTVVGHTVQWADVEELLALRPVDVVVIDVDWEPQEAIGRLRQLARRRPGLRVVVTHDHLSSDEVTAIRDIGVTAIVPHWRGLGALLVALDTGRATPRRQAPRRGITDREIQVLSLIGEGHSVSEMAQRLRISTRTVENHKRRIYAKLQVTSRVEAVGRAASLGILDDHAPGPVPLADNGSLSPFGARPFRPAELSGRELDILQSAARGESVRQTARSLGVAIKTVENLQSLLYRKLGVRNRAEALSVALAVGLLKPPADPVVTSTPRGSPPPP